jgi:hypothetical protein
MKKILLLLCFQLLAGCSPQEQYVFFADFHNACNSTIRVVARHYTNTLQPLETSLLDQQLEADKTLLVLDTWGFSNTPEYGVPPNYKLEIYVDNKKRDFNKNSFLEILKKSKFEFNSGVYTWTISDPTLCPK